MLICFHGKNILFSFNNEDENVEAFLGSYLNAFASSDTHISILKCHCRRHKLINRNRFFLFSKTSLKRMLFDSCSLIQAFRTTLAHYS